MRVHHGLLIITNLAEKFGDGRPLSLEEIAKKEEISHGFLEEIAVPLRSAGLIEGRRGPNGGYRLCKSPAEISIADVIRAIEGPLALVDCLGPEIGCLLVGTCSSKNVWSTIQSQILATLTA
ncbi:Rrf2 family transcriptional regulator, partial [Candidatus Uhrbacteria bacterium]|nr:Rrf2 family transcriptional regulator [Candidatus Uhrbacteria bacterium]